MTKLVKDLPKEIQELVFKRQQEQGNFPNPNIRLYDNYHDGNFNWADTTEGQHFWENIDDGNYKPFYDLYPQEKLIYTLQDLKDGKCWIKQDNPKHVIAIMEHLGIVFNGSGQQSYYRVREDTNDKFHWACKTKPKDIPYQSSSIFMKEIEESHKSISKPDHSSSNKINWDVIVECKNKDEYLKLYKFCRKHGRLSSLNEESFSENNYCFRLSDIHGGSYDKYFYEKQHPDLPIITINEFFNNLNINTNEKSENSKTINDSNGSRNRRSSIESELGRWREGFNPSNRGRRTRSVKLGIGQKQAGDGLCPRRGINRMVKI